MKFLVNWSKNPKAYAKKSHATQDETTQALKRSKEDDNEEIEVGFVYGLFEMFKLRGEIAKA